MPLDALKSSLDKSSQIIVVTVSSPNSHEATLQAFEKIQHMWRPVFLDIHAVVGRNGLSAEKEEGDGRSPVGIFEFGTAFGTIEKISGIKFPYSVTSRYDYWIDDAASDDYNRWVYFEGDPYKRWQSFERLHIAPYKYALVINYNVNPVVKGRGSAIFMHVSYDLSKGTSGCTAVSEEDMLHILQWIDASKNPVFIQCDER